MTTQTDCSTYQRINPRGLENETWRDSWDSLSHADGAIANLERPVAALDGQAAAYDALLAAARHRKGPTANELRERADRLRAAALNRFWTEHRGGFFAAALDYAPTGIRRPLQTRISDMGHLLTSELLDDEGLREYRDAVVHELFSPGMLCSHGVRSLHAEEIRFWAGGYHTGTSWLWQSMHIADGLDVTVPHTRRGTPHAMPTRPPQHRTPTRIRPRRRRSWNPQRPNRRRPAIT